MNFNSIFFKSFSLLDEFGSVSRYSKNRPLKEENNLEHTGWVCSWCYLIGIDIQKELGIEVDFGALLSKAVCHDLDEAITGDVLRTTKYSSPKIRTEFSVLEDESVLSIHSLFHHDFSQDRGVYQDWSTAKETGSIEGNIVKLADLAGVVYKVWQEIMMLNNYCFSSVAKEILQLVQKYSQEGFPLFSSGKGLREYFQNHLDQCIFLLEKCIEKSQESNNSLPSFPDFLKE